MVEGPGPTVRDDIVCNANTTVRRKIFDRGKSLLNLSIEVNYLPLMNLWQSKENYASEVPSLENHNIQSPLLHHNYLILITIIH